MIGEEIPPLVREMEDAIRGVLSDPAWAAADREAQVRQLADALCDALSMDGRPVRIPSAGVLRRRRDLRRRNDEIRRTFTGANYVQLALAHDLTTRQVRRIVDDPRTRRRRQKMTRL